MSNYDAVNYSFNTSNTIPNLILDSVLPNYISASLSDLAELEYLDVETCVEKRANKVPWTDFFCFLVERGRTEKLNKLALLFSEHAKSFALELIDAYLNNQLEKVKQYQVNLAGQAGGEKYCKNNILFKFAIDWKKIYGGTEFSMKAASQELKTINYLISQNSLNRLFSLPCLALFTKFGLRVWASSLLPISKSTLVYGSDDAGLSIKKTNETMNKMFQAIGQILNLKEHKFNSNSIIGPIDVEGHVGIDKKFYIIDTTRLFPPEKPSKLFPQSIYYYFLQAKLILSSKKALNSDVFSPFFKSDEDDDEQIATELSQNIYSTIIPNLSSLILNKTISINSNEQVKQILHGNQLSMRHLPFLIVSILKQRNDIEPIPLSESIKIEQHAHELKIRHPTSNADSTSHNCDICQNKIEDQTWYSCKPCDFDCHINENCLGLKIPTSIEQGIWFLMTECCARGWKFHWYKQLLSNSKNNNETSPEKITAKVLDEILNHQHIEWVEIVCQHFKSLPNYELINQTLKPYLILLLTENSIQFRKHVEIRFFDLNAIKSANNNSSLEVGVRIRTVSIPKLRIIKELQQYEQEQIKLFSSESPILTSTWIEMARGFEQLTIPNYEESEKYYVKSLKALERDQNQAGLIGVKNLYGILLLKRGKFEQARLELSDCVELKEKLLGTKNHPDYGASLNALASVLHHQSKYQECLDLYEQAKSIIEKSAGKQHPDYSSTLSNIAVRMSRDQLQLGKESIGYSITLNNLSSVLRDQANFEEANKLHLECIHLHLKLFGPDHPEYAFVISNYARTLYAQSNFNESLKLVQQALIIQEKSIGKTHANYISTLLQFSEILQRMGKLKESLSYFDVCRQTLLKNIQLGENFDRGLYAKACEKMSQVLTNMGKLSESFTLISEAEKIRKVEYGVDHPDYAAVLNDVGDVLAKQNRFEDALSKYQTALGIIERSFGKSHPNYASILFNVGLTLSELHRFEEALITLDACKKLRETIIGKNHADYASTLEGIGHVLNDSGKPEEAFQYFEQCKEIRLKVLGNQHPDYATSLQNLGFQFKQFNQLEKAEQFYNQSILGNLGSLYEEQGRLEEALQVYEESRKIELETIGEIYPQYATTISNIATVLDTIGRSEEALQLFLKCKTIQEKTIGINHPQYATTLSEIGVVLVGKKQFQMALGMFERCKQIRLSILGNKHPLYADALSNLATVLFQLKYFDKALEFTNEALKIDGIPPSKRQMMLKNLETLKKELLKK